MRFNLPIALFLVAALAGIDAQANPIPIPESGGEPYPTEYFGDVVFRSERVVYTINDPDTARVRAVYLLQNRANVTASLNISLPFDYYEHIPDDLSLTADGQPVPYAKTDGDYRLHYDFIRFQLHFGAGQTVALNASYSVRIARWSARENSEPGPGIAFVERFWCRYISETGRYWSNTLDSAQFEFRIKKEFFGSGLDDFNKTESGGYVVATKTYYDWRPDSNINAHWQRPDNGRTILAFSPYIILVVCIAGLAGGIVLHRRRKRKRELLQRSREGAAGREEPGLRDG